MCVRVYVCVLLDTSTRHVWHCQAPCHQVGLHPTTAEVPKRSNGVTALLLGYLPKYRCVFLVPYQMPTLNAKRLNHCQELDAGGFPRSSTCNQYLSPEVFNDVAFYHCG